MSIKEAVRPLGKFRSFNPKYYWEFNGGDRFVKNVRLRNGGHFKIRPHKVGLPFVTKQ